MDNGVSKGKGMGNRFWRSSDSEKSTRDGGVEVCGAYSVFSQARLDQSAALDANMEIYEVLP